MGRGRRKNHWYDPGEVTGRCGKVVYRSHAAADHAKRMLIKKPHRRLQRRDGKLGVYFCHNCAGYHLGHSVGRWDEEKRKRR